jgi:Tfp pilus assembly protein PilO
MRKLSPRERKLLGLAAAAVLAFVAWRFFYAPLAERWQIRRSQASALQAELARHRLSIRQKSQVEQSYRRLEEAIRQEGTSEEQISKLILELRRKYSRLALIDKGTRVLPVEEGGFYRKFPIRMELEGRAVPLAEFLEAVVTAPEPLRVEELTVRATGRYEVVRSSVLVTGLYASPRRER